MNTRLDSNKLRGIGLAALVMSVAAGAGAQTYTATDLGTLPGGSYSSATGINNSGQVVGHAEVSTSTFGQHPFLYSGGTMIDLGTLPGACGCYTFESATGINNSGQIVGNSDYQNSFGSSHPFLYSGGTMIDLGTLPDTYAPTSYAYSLNDTGQVAGWSNTGSVANVASHAFLYSDGVMTDLGTLKGGPSSFAYGINNNGQVVGQAYTPSSIGEVGHAFLYSAGGMIDLGTFGGFWSSAFGINNRGQVVGQAETATGFQYQHAFVYGGGTMVDLGTLPAPFVQSTALAINNSGQVVGYSDNAAGLKHAFLYSDGTMTDLNSLVNTFPTGVYLTDADGINDLGQIAANGSNGHAYLLTPGNSPGILTVLNPFLSYTSPAVAPPTLDVPTVMSSRAASSLAADGESAVVLTYQSNSPLPVTFALSAGLTPGTAVGSLGPFDPNYLVNPVPVTSNSQTYQVTTPTSGPDAAGKYVFLALLWAPNAMPVPNVALANLAVTAAQQGRSGVSQASVALDPPPVLLVHGIWSSAAGAGFTPGSNGFYDWVAPKYPQNLIFPVDYGPESSKAFNDPSIQNVLLSSMTDALAKAAAAGMAARTVDVVAHSMGGLVARYFMSQGPPSPSPDLLPNPVHKLITIGTPHLGSSLATTLDANQGNLPGPVLLLYPELLLWCPLSNCTLGSLMGAFGHQVGAGTQSLEPNSTALGELSPSNEFAAIVGQAPTSPISLTEGLLDALIGAFVPGQSVASILGEPNDTIVPGNSQSPLSGGQTDTATVTGVVHANLCDVFLLSLVCSDIGETQSQPPSQPVFEQAFYWLTGGIGTASAASSDSNGARRSLKPAMMAQAPVLDLSGFTQAPASNVTFLPASGSVLTINSATDITATSSTKTITEVLLPQTVTDPTDTPFLYATQSPFTISFTPTRLGSASFGPVAVFSDNTYAVTTLNYTLQPAGTPYALNLVNAPVASMTVGTSRVIDADAIFTSGPIDVTQAATYTARSGSLNVFTVSSGGTITANGSGVDLLDVSYGGVTVTAPVAVGTCTYALNPSNQIARNTGGPVAIQVTTQPGCAWTATGGASWLTLTGASGSGNGAITLTAAPNNAGGTQGAVVLLGGLQAFVTQPATTCTYSLSQTQINAPAAGASGTIGVTTSCPVVASSDATWVTAMPLGSSVSYTVAVNNGTSQRTATLTIGTQPVSVVQAANITYTISGQATLSGTGLAGVTMTLSGSQSGTTTTDGSGDYSFTEAAGGSYTVTPTLSGFTFSPPSQNFNSLSGNQAANFISSGVVTTSGLLFVSMPPCRVVDTRDSTKPAGFGPPFVSGGKTISYAIPNGPCNGIPSASQAYSLNVTVVPHGELGYLTVWPAGQSQPLASTLNSLDGEVKANAAIVPAGSQGAISVYATNDTDVVLDINGYFVPPNTVPNELAFYPMTPCRLVDTRPGAPSTISTGALTGGVSRTLPILSSSCNVPATAQAYSLNFTLVPPGPVGYLTVYPTGESLPIVSTLNDPTGTVEANAAIAPAGSGGSIGAFVTQTTDLVVDINGYFAPVGAGGLSLYTLPTCRVLDTRNPPGSPPFEGSINVNIGSSCGATGAAQAYVFNATVVPDGMLGYLTLWPQGSVRPVVSTLNAYNGEITSNMAIVPAGNTEISAFASNSTYLILDISGYFAP